MAFLEASHARYCHVTTDAPSGKLRIVYQTRPNIYPVCIFQRKQRNFAFPIIPPFPSHHHSFKREREREKTREGQQGRREGGKKGSVKRKKEKEKKAGSKKRNKGKGATQRPRGGREGSVRKGECLKTIEMGQQRGCRQGRASEEGSV